MPSYWIAHPTERAFISALSPEGVAQLLKVAEPWPPGRYIILQHHHGLSQTGTEDRPWRYTIKDSDGRVRIEPLDETTADD